MFWSPQNPCFPKSRWSRNLLTMTKNMNLGGRPQKIKGLKKVYKITAKMSTGEYYIFLDKVKQANLNKSEYIRACVESSQITERISVEHQKLIRKLCGMANNLNQLAKQANAQGYTTAYKDALYLLNEIDILIKQIINDRKNNT